MDSGGREIARLARIIQAAKAKKAVTGAAGEPH
jgi:hypothetical protein